MAIHELKCWPTEFEAVWGGTKRHEIRKADRAYAAGDALVLQEYEPIVGTYSGRWIRAQVTYLTSAGTWDLPADCCVMSVQVSERHLAVEPSEYNKSHGPTASAAANRKIGG
jgi:hypothetical protein